MRRFMNNNKVMLSLWLVLALFFSLMPIQVMGMGQEIFAKVSEKQETGIKINTDSLGNRIEIATGQALKYNGKDQHANSTVTINNYTEQELETVGIKFYYGKQEYKTGGEDDLYTDANPYTTKYPLYREAGTHVFYCIAKDSTGHVIATGSAVVVILPDEQESENVPDEMAKNLTENKIKVTTGSAVYGSEEARQSLVKGAEYGEDSVTIEYSKYQYSGYSDEKPIYSDAGTHIVYYRAIKEDSIIATGETSVVIYPKELKQTDIVPDQSQLIYDGLQKKITADCPNLEKQDDCTVNLENENADLKIINAGTYKAAIREITGQGVQNYRWPTKEKIEIVISQRELGIEWTKEGKRAEYKSKEKQGPTPQFLNVADRDIKNPPQIIKWSVNGKSVNGVTNVGKYKIKATELDNPNYKLPNDTSTEFVIFPQVKAKEVTWGKKKQTIKFSQLVNCDSKALKNISITNKHRKKTKNFLKINKKSQCVEIRYTKNKIKMKKIPLTVKLKGKLKGEMANEKLNNASINIKLRPLKKIKIVKSKVNSQVNKYYFKYNVSRIPGATGIQVRLKNSRKLKKGANKAINNELDYFMKNEKKGSSNRSYIRFKRSTIKKLGGKITFMIKICYGKNKSKQLSTTV